MLAGRRTVEQVDHWGGDHDGLPILVPSHRPPEAGVLDELQIHQIPVRFGRGRRLFEVLWLR